MSVIKVKDNNEFIDIATIQGPIGPQGEQGPIGVGVPADGPTAPGTFLAKTGASADATSWQNIFNLIYPVGSIYLSTNNANPGTLFGGSWEQIQDRFLLACGDKYTNGATGGEATHTLTIDEMPSHSHSLIARTVLMEAGTNYGTYIADGNYNTSAVGGSQPHNNMPPYLVVYIWKRIS